MLMAALISACQPQSNIQTGLQTLKTTLPSLDKTLEDEAANDNVEWRETVIVSGDSDVDAIVAVIEATEDVVVEPADTTTTTTESSIEEAMELNGDETAHLLEHLLRKDSIEIDY